MFYHLESMFWTHRCILHNIDYLLVKAANKDVNKSVFRRNYVAI